MPNIEARPSAPDASPDDRATRRRAAVVEALQVADAPADDELDVVVRLAARLTGMPVAMVTVLDAVHQHQAAVHGGTPASTPVQESLCARAVREGGVVAVPDLSADPRFSDSAWVDGRLDDLRAYIGAPLTVDDVVVGTLCVAGRTPVDVDTAPDGEIALALTDLARIVVALLERRRDNRSSQQAQAVLAQRNAELAEANHELARSRAFDQALLETLPVGVVAADADRRVRLFNRVSRIWHGSEVDSSLDPDELPTHYDLFDSDGATPLDADRIPLLRVFDEGAVDEVEIVIAPHGLPARRVSCTGRPVLDRNGDLLGAVMGMADVTEQRQLEARLRAAALHDGLTGLPNRALVLDRIRQSLAATGRGHGRIAVLYCDLDGFKAVNDAHGHATGDEILVETAARLQAAVRPGDTVARMGGDEFVLCCADIGDDSAADHIAARIEHAFAPGTTTATGVHQVGISVGIALSAKGSTAEELVAAADRAMYTRKARRRTRPGPGR